MTDPVDVVTCSEDLLMNSLLSKLNEYFLRLYIACFTKLNGQVQGRTTAAQGSIQRDIKCTFCSPVMNYDVVISSAEINWNLLIKARNTETVWVFFFSCKIKLCKMCVPPGQGKTAFIHFSTACDLMRLNIQCIFGGAKNQLNTRLPSHYYCATNCSFSAVSQDNIFVWSCVFFLILWNEITLQACFPSIAL